MKRAATAVLIAVSMTLAGSGTALAQSGHTNATAKRCPSRACRDSHAHVAAVATPAPGQRA